MKMLYVPIMRAMAAEFDALQHMPESDKGRLIPLLEIPRLTTQAREAKRYRECEEVVATYLNEKAAEIAKVWKGRTAIVDAFHWPHDASTEHGEHILPFIYSALESLGVKVAPVIGYDRWESLQYQTALRSIDFRGRQVCLRLDSSAIEDAMEPDFFQDNIESILSGLPISVSQISVLIDFGDITQMSVEDVIARAGAVLEITRNFKFASYAVAGCSLPPTIELAVKKQDSTGVVIRKESLAWQALRKAFPGLRLAMGDYGVRGPKSNEGVRNPHTNGKIRYTTERAFFIARGHSMQEPGKGEQMWTLAEKVAASHHFVGENFSWGDSQVVACSQRKIKGGAGQWIAYDTSHHLAFVLAEVQAVVLASGPAHVPR